MFDHAIHAGVSIEAPEMQHFSRWLFSQARICGAIGEKDVAEKLFELALLCSKHVDPMMRLISITSKFLGWRLTGKLCNIADKLRKGQTSRYTLPLSWSQETHSDNR